MACRLPPVARRPLFPWAPCTPALCPPGAVSFEPSHPSPCSPAFSHTHSFLCPASSGAPSKLPWFLKICVRSPDPASL